MGVLSKATIPDVLPVGIQLPHGTGSSRSPRTIPSSAPVHGSSSRGDNAAAPQGGPSNASGKDEIQVQVHKNIEHKSCRRSTAQADPKEARLERIEKAIQQITQSMLDASNSNNIKMDNNKNKDKIPENAAFGSSASTSLTMEQEHNSEAVAFSEETCKFWKTHACWRGDDCNFLHAKRKMCRSMYARARYKCEYGDKCWWAHSEEEQVDTHELY